MSSLIQMTSLKSPAGSAEDGSRAFALQYTALMLTILAFVVGAFAGERVRENKQPHPQMLHEKQGADESLNAPYVIAEVDYDGLFTLRNGELTVSQRAAALAHLLTSHDLKLEGVIGVKNSENMSPDARLELAGDQSLALTKYLMHAGVPEHAIDMFASDAPATHEGSFRVIKLLKDQAFERQGAVNDG